jgi:hypothetical protein
MFILHRSNVELTIVHRTNMPSYEVIKRGGSQKSFVFHKPSRRPQMTKLLKTAFVAVALTFSAQAVQAQAYFLANSQRFTHEPTGYDVVTSYKADGRMLLRGSKPSGETFRILVAKDGHVTGIYEGQKVDYMLSDTVKQQIALND